METNDYIVEINLESQHEILQNLNSNKGQKFDCRNSCKDELEKRLKLASIYQTLQRQSEFKK